MKFEPNENFEYYLYWIQERMNIFWSRNLGLEDPHTEDEILKKFKFTNVYRCLDRVSQYLIDEVIYDRRGLDNDRDTEDIFFRIIFFKHFNHIGTWEALENEFGEITLETIREEKSIVSFLSEIQRHGPIYSNAYMLTASFMRNPKILEQYGVRPLETKHSSYLKILKKDLFYNPPKLYHILKSGNLQQLQERLETVNTMGKFLSMQYAIDLNYSPLFNFDENQHVVAGPGAERGIQRTFHIEGKPDYLEIIKWTTENFESLMKQHNRDFIPIGKRMPTLIDIQNCFCEVDKYLRGRGIETEGVDVYGQRIKNSFNPNSSKINYKFPPKWGIEF